MELRLDRCQVRKDVGVVVLEVGEHRGAWPIPHELRALIEEGGVVLVGLDHEEGRGGGARRHAEVARHAADQETGIEPRMVQDPGEHRRGGALAVRPRDREHPLVHQHVLGEPLRTGGVGEPAVEHRLHHRLAARHDVADDAEVRLVFVELRGVVALMQADAEVAQLVAHRRIDLGVAAGDDVAALARDLREAAHESAANAEDVEMQGILEAWIEAMLGLAGREILALRRCRARV